MKYFFVSVLMFMPLSLVLAQNGSTLQGSPLVSTGTNGPVQPKTVNEIFINFALFNGGLYIEVLVLVGFITFVSGVVQFVNAGDNEEKRATGRSIMIYGIIILFVMISVWGFVRILTQSFFSSDPGIPNYLPPIQPQ